MEHNQEKEEWCGPECSKAHIHDGELFPADIRASQPPRKGDDLTAGLKREAAKPLPMTTPTHKENWRDRIRTSYAGIVSDEQIQATIEYWEEFISQVEHSAIEKEWERIKTELEEKLLIKCECELGNCDNCLRLMPVIDSLTKDTNHD